MALSPLLPPSPSTHTHAGHTCSACPKHMQAAALLLKSTSSTVHGKKGTGYNPTTTKHHAMRNSYIGCFTTSSPATRFLRHTLAVVTAAGMPRACQPIQAVTGRCQPAQQPYINTTKSLSVEDPRLLTGSSHAGDSPSETSSMRFPACRLTAPKASGRPSGVWHLTNYYIVQYMHTPHAPPPPPLHCTVKQTTRHNPNQRWTESDAPDLSHAARLCR